MRIFFLLFCFVHVIFAQQSGSFSAAEIATLQQVRADSVGAIPKVTYRWVKLSGRTEAVAWRAFWGLVGGEEHRPLLKFLNRDQLNVQKRGDSLIVPSVLGLDLRAYAPFPLLYEGAQQLDKLVVIDKQYQLFAAYAFGRLERWGVVCTGAKRYAETPNGRFNMNWKQAFRVSSESPQGEQWRMRWVSNFYRERGIHTHQSAEVLLSGPGSHGCVRMTETDAKWIYDWTSGWTTNRRGEVTKLGTMVIVQGENPPQKVPKWFQTLNGVISPILISLPLEPQKVSAGSPQQRLFDARTTQNPQKI